MSKKQVLVVDDQPGIRMLLEEVIKSEGYGVYSAENGSQALDMIQEKQPDLTIVDYNLPVMNGGELLKKLDEKNYEKPVILMTGMAVESLSEESNYPFVRKVIAKPFNIDDLREDISGMLV
ncbi:response regulator [Thalassobacillus hwangdonensis]|uniref:Response regulator n=1 Tax=Thalassobacillus hwangdonensis TaxID=546108 RepID=A0ABW3L2P3_9BACI